MPSGIIVTCVATPALPCVLPHRRLARSPHTEQYGQRCRNLGPPSRERGPASTEPEAAAGLGRPSGARRTDQAPASGVDGAPAGHADYDHALASAVGRPPLDISQPVRSAADRPGHRRPSRAGVPGQSRLGLPKNRPTTGAGTPRPHHLAKIPIHPGIHHARLRFLPRRLRAHPPTPVRLLRLGGRQPLRAHPRRHRQPRRAVATQAGIYSWTWANGPTSSKSSSATGPGSSPNAFDAVLADVGTTVCKIPPRSPRANTYAEHSMNMPVTTTDGVHIGPLQPQLSRSDRPVVDLTHERIKRRPVLGGLVIEYELAA